MATKKTTEIRRISFNAIKYDELLKIVNLKANLDPTAFDEWFGYDYKLNEEEEKLFRVSLKSQRLK